MSDFYKYQILGNSYIIINNINIKPHKSILRLICNKKYGLYSDGVIYGPNIMYKIYTGCRIFNVDGYEIEKSGNGIKIFAFFLIKKMKLKNIIFLITKFSDFNIIFKKLYNMFFFIRYNNQIVNLFIQTKKRFNFIYTNVGNSHMFNIKPKNVMNYYKGKQNEKCIYFPNKTNFHNIKIINNINMILKIWERGVGVTLSSTTSVIVTSYIVKKLYLLKNIFNISMKGGLKNILVLKNNIYMESYINNIYIGLFPYIIKDILLGNEF